MCKLYKAVISEGRFNGIRNGVRRVRGDNLVISPVILDDFAHGVIGVRVSYSGYSITSADCRIIASEMTFVFPRDPVRSVP